MRAILRGSLTVCVILLFVGAILGLFLDAAWSRYVALIGVCGWAFCGITLLKMRRRST